MPVSMLDATYMARSIVRDVLGTDVPIETWFQALQTADGEDAVRIILFFPDSRASGITGDQLLDIAGRVRRTLPEIGETRVPLISFGRMEDHTELAGA